MAKKKEDSGVVAPPRIHMGSDLLDLMVGGDKGVYGVPFGGIVQIFGDSSTGKAAPLDTKVLTPDGWKLMGDIKVGDTVVTPYRGQHAKVLGVYPQGERDVYRFYLNDNTTVESADNHYWVVQSPNQYNGGKNTTFGSGRGYFLVTTKELAEIYKDGIPAPANVVALPLIEPVEYAPRETPKIPPYLMGILIAEGSLAYSTPKITVVESDIMDKISQQVKSIGMKLHPTSDGVSHAIVLPPESSGRSWLPAYIRELGLDCKSVDKHIPEQYLYGSVTERVELLHGLFDGDGYMSKQGCASYSTSSKQLAQDVADLARSLGLKATISKPKKPFYTKGKERYIGHDAYIVSLVPGKGIMPFSSKKHAARMRKSLDGSSAYTRTRRRLQAVEYIGKKPCQCIYIDHPMHLYLMDNFVPTHNTFIKNEMLACTYWRLKNTDYEFVWESDDCETGDTFDTLRLYGVDFHPPVRVVGKNKFVDSETLEEMDGKLTNMLSAMKENMYGIYALDSLDGLCDSNKKVKEAKRAQLQAQGKPVVDEGDYGAQGAKFLSQEFFKVKHKPLEQKNTTLLIISQTRCNFGAGMYGPKRKASNSDALDFYAYARIQLKRKQPIIKDGLVVGGVVEATTIKCKVPRPYRSVMYSFYFDYGIDNIGSNIDYLFDLLSEDGKLKKAAEAIPWSENAKPKNLNNLKDWLAKNKWTDVCKDDRKAEQGSSALTVEWIIGWANSDPARKESFDNEFGEEFTREELIKLCEDNPEMAEELTRRVREKWEAHEDAAATKRPSKYACYMEQPKADKKQEAKPE